MSDLPADVVGLLDEPCTAHIATLLPDGAPHTVPVWVGREGGYVAFLTSPNSRKGRNIERDPRVAISLTRRDRPTDSAYLRGRSSRSSAATAGGRSSTGCRRNTSAVPTPCAPTAPPTSSRSTMRQPRASDVHAAEGP